MNRFDYTNLAKNDLLEIGRFSVGTFGNFQAARYLEDLELCCELLALISAMGRSGDTRAASFDAWKSTATFSSTARRLMVFWWFEFCKKGWFPQNRPSMRTELSRR